jgi:DNA-directed RNA polymerase specialized sigma subunit
VLADERILGSGDFVERILKEADDKLKHELAANKRRHDAERFIEQVCAKEKINSNELRMGSRRGRISQVRSKIACQLVEDYGLPLAEIARKLGVSTSAVSKALTRAARE